MPFFCILCTDKPGVLERRLATRPAHVDYLNSRTDMLRLAGPRLDDQGKMCGSLFVVETADRADAEAFNADDPYTKAGLFAEVEILGFDALRGSWVS